MEPEGIASDAPEELNRGLIQFAHEATSRLTGSTRKGEEDLEGIRVGLRDALDTGKLLQSASDRGIPIRGELIDAVEELVRATIGTYPFLQRAALDCARNSRDDTSLINSLRSRSVNANVALHKGLEGAYRSHFESEAES